MLSLINSCYEVASLNDLGKLFEYLGEISALLLTSKVWKNFISILEATKLDRQNFLLTCGLAKKQHTVHGPRQLCERAPPCVNLISQEPNELRLHSNRIEY